MTGDIDVFLSHDWPTSVPHHGNLEQLLRVKKFLRDEIAQGTLGNPACEKILRALQPKYWFSAHLHVKYPAIVRHSTGKSTKFLALDKCLPHRDFLQVCSFTIFVEIVLICDCSCDLKRAMCWQLIKI
eukprot:TRINITY_DN2698_c0_g1_i5.p1 TRINITY_DN2698_c0_g1~~TRINITY_DN2698_c0_g1_i5.p1  ORF type:complete len:128 (-),score=16.03 TRINITY_DN2698_c0_g1_i5:95-478(-)